tara:strand:- start:760 stop:1131 length:372 start_codon:yes stop_codon:yes gene_type:complete
MNPRYIQYSWQKYYNQAGAHYTDTSTIEKDMWEENIANKEERRKNITKKVEKLRERIEAWCNKNGYDKMDNDVERKDEEGTIYYRRTDWDMVDDLYGLLINDEQWWPHPNQFLKMNELWKRYR